MKTAALALAPLLAACAFYDDGVPAPADPDAAIAEPEADAADLVGEPPPAAPPPDVILRCPRGLVGLEWHTLQVDIELHTPSGIGCIDDLWISGNEVFAQHVPCDWDGRHRIFFRLPKDLGGTLWLSSATHGLQGDDAFGGYVPINLRPGRDYLLRIVSVREGW